MSSAEWSGSVIDRLSYRGARHICQPVNAQPIVADLVKCLAPRGPVRNDGSDLCTIRSCSAQTHHPRLAVPSVCSEIAAAGGVSDTVLVGKNPRSTARGANGPLITDRSKRDLKSVMAIEGRSDFFSTGAKSGTAVDDGPLPSRTGWRGRPPTGEVNHDRTLNLAQAWLVGPRPP